MSIASARIVLAAAAAPLLLAAAGCSSTTPAANFVATSDVTGAIGETAATRPVRGADLSLALATMPEPFGSQVDLREKFFANGFRQDIVLAGDKAGFGDNILQVTVQTAPAAAGMRDQAPLYAPSERGIKQEIVARYPQVDMQILTQPRRNPQGPFGLAIGRTANGVRCIFAWQYIEDIRNPSASSSTLGRIGNFGSSGQPAAIRVQMCRKDATVDELASAVEGLTLSSASLMDRSLDPGRFAASPVASTRSVGGGMVASAGDGTLESALGPSRSAPQAVASAPAPERRRVATRRVKKPVVAEESDQQQSPVAATAPVQTYTGGPRYMAPVAGAPAQTYAPAATAYNNAPVYSAPSYAPSYSSSSTKSLDPSLPAAAYRGPSSR